MVGDIQQRAVDRLKLGEEGEISNPRIEQYALLRSEEVVTPSAAWIIITSSASGHRASGTYRGNIHRSPIFRARLEGLMAEKATLETQGVWGRLEWQARQVYRKAAAMNDLRAMQQATDSLLKIALRTDKATPPPTNDDAEGVHRGPGAPAVETPNAGPDHLAERFLLR